MNQDQGTVLRSGRVIDSSSEIESPADPNMAQANSNDSDTNDSSDISSQLSEIKESYERRINELHQEFSQLKDLMMAIVSKNCSESQPSSSKGPSKPAQQHGFDTYVTVFVINKTFLAKIYKIYLPTLKLSLVVGKNYFLNSHRQFLNYVHLLQN